MNFLQIYTFYLCEVQGLMQSYVNTNCSQAEIQGGPFSMDCRERESHARGVYPTQDTSRMETA